MKRIESSKKIMVNKKKKAAKKYADFLENEMLEEWRNFSDMDEGWLLGYLAEYETGCHIEIPSYATEQFKRGYETGAYVGRKDFLRDSD